MDELTEGVKAAASVVTTVHTWLASALSTLDQYNYLPMSERRKKNMLDKADIEQLLETRRAEHLQEIEIAAAQSRVRIALMEGTSRLALESAKKKIEEGMPVEQAYQACIPSAVRAANNLFIDTIEGDYAAERIGLYAAKCASASPDEPIGEEQTSKTWKAAFWNYARGIRDEEAMQQWGRLLAEEIRRPGKFSIRTLDVLRTLSSRSAVNFNKLSQYVFSDLLIPWPSGNSSIAKPISLGDYETGLLVSDGLLMDGKVFNVKEKRFLQNRHYLVTVESSTAYSFEVLTLTNVGRELYSLVEVTKELSFASAKYLYSIFDAETVCSTEIAEIDSQV